jgi:site-specific recombinase XerD
MAGVSDVEREAMGAYLIYLRRRGLSDRTIGTRRAILGNYVGWVEAKGLDGHAAEEDVQVWLDSRLLGTRSRYSYLSVLTCFYRFAMKSGRAGMNPAEDIERPKLPPLFPRPISDADLAFALSQAEPMMRCWLELCAYQGFRCVEVSRLRREDVLESRDPPQIVIARGKGEKPGVLPLNRHVERSLRVYGMPSRGFAFVMANGRPFRPATVSTNIARYLRNLNVDATAHQLRHWGGSAVLRRTNNMLTTRDFLRHASIDTTQIYTALDQPQLFSVVRDLGVDAPVRHPTLFDA